MIDSRIDPASKATAAEAAASDLRPAYERPCVVKKKAVTRATLFTGGGPTAVPPLVAHP